MYGSNHAVQQVENHVSVDAEATAKNVRMAEAKEAVTAVVTAEIAEAQAVKEEALEVIEEEREKKEVSVSVKATEAILQLLNVNLHSVTVNAALPGVIPETEKEKVISQGKNARVNSFNILQIRKMSGRKAGHFFCIHPGYGFVVAAFHLF